MNNKTTLYSVIGVVCLLIIGAVVFSLSSKKSDTSLVSTMNKEKTAMVPEPTAKETADAEADINNSLADDTKALADDANAATQTEDQLASASDEVSNDLVLKELSASDSENVADDAALDSF